MSQSIAPGVFYRLRVLAEGRGWQVREYEDLVKLDGEVTAEHLQKLVAEALDGFQEALIEAHETTRELADDGGLPPGVSYGEPSALVVMVEPVQGLLEALTAQAGA